MTYADTLKAARKVGASKASDAQVMALLCDGTLQILCGAGLSPKMVFDGAQSKGMTSKELLKLMSTDVFAVSDLMWA